MVALYRNVMEYLLQYIREHNLKVGDALPTEAELESQLGVSRTTVRTALAELRYQGIITQTRGRGTFVSGGALEEQLSRLTSFTEQALDIHRVPSSVVLSKDIIVADERLCDALQLTGGNVFKLSRLRLMDNCPIQIGTSYLPIHAIDALPDWDGIDFRTASLYATLEAAGVVLKYAEERLQIEEAGYMQAALLNIEIGKPLFFSQRTVYDADDVPVEFAEVYSRAEQHRIISRFQR